MKNYFLILLVGSALFFGCNENDEVVPRTNPRFSVTYVQEISATGAEFFANIYYLGSDEILEYGFVYSKESEPRIGAGEIVKAEGQPADSFKLVGDHSMIKGQRYNVVAFISTSKTTTYSQSISFTSQGSEGFLFERLTGGPEVYYGDTLTVYGDKLSTNLANYEVRVNAGISRVIDLQKDSFKIIIPEDLGFGYTYDYDGKIVVNIKILDKSLEIFPDVKFYDPIFYDYEKELKYEDNFYLKGKYLRDGNTRLSYSNQYLEVVSSSDTLIVFKPNANFETLQPVFMIYMRGKAYEVNNVVRIERTELLPNQQLKMGTIYSHLVIKGTNFNSVNPYNNMFVSDTDAQEQQFYMQESTSTEARLEVNNSYLIPNPRFFKVYSNNGGVRSTNFVSVENTEPMLVYMRMHAFPFNVASDGRSVSWRGKGIWLGDGKISEIDPVKKSGKILKNVDINQGNIASSFAVVHQDVLYFAGKDQAISNTPGRFYSYDLNSGLLKELAAIPSKASTPRALFVSGGNLYFGGGFYIDEVDVQKVSEGYKFNLATKTWSSWSKVFPTSDYYDFETTFVHKEQVFGLVNEIVGSDVRATRLMRFDGVSEDWVELANYPYLSYSNGNASFSIGENVYVFLNGTLHLIDMRTYVRKQLDDVSFYDRGYSGPPLLFLSDQKIYYASYNDYVLNEIDPNYFRE
ncbi:Kelch repeat-containing protein [Algoriphagus antarcticus]|uniref:IPT/TIG domain-containing protein n=1 Tax=Algoriphagus antarcticus TaxID=238540 RepID=A0A3E0DNQ7_9BACT|nr:hypothetical protein [Algoriphagus antarcticus]REG84476.1 hypothetical protein C8N25_11551 [Algoriphagus antarcticus]